MTAKREVVDNLAQLLEVLPPQVRNALNTQPSLDQLLEMVLDLGRQAEARYPNSFVYLGSASVTKEDIEYAVKRVGSFGLDNRAGIERTLHRISAIRNRQGEIVGLTCRIGRAVFGTIDIIRDVVEMGKSILLLGRPGVGKTTMLREVARVLADDLNKRVVIVDTSNEIAGDGDIPHPAIGHARRMQVSRTDRQADVMIEAVENHMPEVIVIDEIGTEAEALAARTIAERGVQLIATAHGNTLENLILNPTLSDLVGGIHAVTLGDEEAKKRGTQKTVLERKAPPTFDVVVEIIEKDRLAIHADVASTVDMVVRGAALRPQVRVRRETGEMIVMEGEPRPGPFPPRWPIEVNPWRDSRLGGTSQGAFLRGDPGSWNRDPGGRRPRRARAIPGKQGAPAKALVSGEHKEPDEPGEIEDAGPLLGRVDLGGQSPRLPWEGADPLRVYPYAISRSRLERAINDLGVPVHIAETLEGTDLILTSKGQYRRMPKKLKEAERKGIAVQTVRSNTYAQIQGFVHDLATGDGAGRALMEAEKGVQQVKSGAQPVELSPQSAYLRKLQHELIERYRLRSTSVGEEPNRRVVVMPEVIGR
ncbi:MAG: AAA family ATPase [Firmicutes bacterium]|nr:AAA family ATPase [Bacillota bacterium]